MKIKIILTILLFLSSYAFAGQKDVSNTIETTAGEEFIITLDGNATTGYEWQLAKPVDDNLVKLIHSEYIPNKTNLVGSGGKSVWTFKAIRAGKTQIFLKYFRRWEKDTPPAETAAYIVSIHLKTA